VISLASPSSCTSIPSAHLCPHLVLTLPSYRLENIIPPPPKSRNLTYHNPPHPITSHLSLGRSLSRSRPLFAFACAINHPTISNTSSFQLLLLASILLNIPYYLLIQIQHFAPRSTTSARSINISSSPLPCNRPFAPSPTSSNQYLPPPLPPSPQPSPLIPPSRQVAHSAEISSDSVRYSITIPSCRHYPYHSIHTSY
jgi:hypothetical protein